MGADGLIAAKKALSMGADGLIAVCSGAGGHAGRLSPFALIPEIRQFFDGPLLLSGSIATGGAVAGALAIGADLAYIGTRFIASKEANAEVLRKVISKRLLIAQVKTLSITTSKGQLKRRGLIRITSRAPTRNL